MSNATEYAELQSAELEALKAIFMQDFNLVDSHTVWKTVNAVHEFTIKIYPQSDDILKQSVHLLLHIKLPKLYPKMSPHFTLEHIHGLTSDHISALTALINKTIKELQNSEMIYEIATTAAQFITEHNAILRNTSLSSLNTDRAKRNQIHQEEAAKQAEKIQLQSRIEQEEQERYAQQEYEATQQQRQQLRSLRLADNPPSPPSSHSDSLAITETFEKPLKLPGNLSATTLIVGPVQAKTALGTYYHAQAFVSSRHSIRIPVSLFVAEIYSPYYATPAGSKKLDVLTDLIEATSSLSPQKGAQNLLEIYGYHKAQMQDLVSQGWKVCIVSEPLPNMTIEDLLQDAGEIRVEKAIPMLASVASALQALHLQDATHRSLTPSHIHIGRTETGQQILKLSSSAWYTYLLDLNRSNRFLSSSTPLPSSTPDTWKHPYLLSHPLADEKSFDVWDFGVLVAKMLHGLDVGERYESPGHFLASIGEKREYGLLKGIFGQQITSASALIHALEKLAIPEASLSSSSSQKHVPPSITPNSPTPASPGLLMPLVSTAAVFSPPSPLPPHQQAGLFFQPRPNALVSPISRYRSEFIEVEKLGQGGFGQVVKARNKLDNNFYAIKKVKLPKDAGMEGKILREVTIWGRLSHPGIVRYHTSWVETEGGVEKGGEESSEDTMESESDLNASMGLVQPAYPSTASSTTSSSDAEEEAYESSSSSDNETIGDLSSTAFDLDLDDLDFISTSGAHGPRHSVPGSRSMSAMPTIHFGNESDPSNEPSRVGTPALRGSPGGRNEEERESKMTRTLYIQMEFVSGQTLREQIDDGLSTEDMWRILRQLLAAMRYYTSFNIIHRDLKPSNILINANGSVRIADFGLAVEQSAPDQLANMSSSVFRDKDATSASDLTSGVGTSLYLAPETVERKKVNEKASRYTDKIDVYSLGIIIFEMCWPIQTRMERIDILKSLRRPEITFPSEWKDSEPIRAKQGKLIRWCLTHDPSKRASPQDLLQSDLIPPALQDDYIGDTIALLSQPNSPHLQTILKALFESRSLDRRATDMMFDIDFEDSELNSPYDSVVGSKMTEIFQLRGAVDLAPPLLLPASEMYESKPRKPVSLLTDQGIPVQLPYDLVYPLARFVARDDSITRLKRYNISPVYREDRMGGQPKAFLAAAFDVISSHYTLVAEAECIQTTDEILHKLTPSETFVHVMGHSDFIDTFISQLAPTQLLLARRVLERYELQASPWSQVVGELTKLGMPRKSLDELAALDLCASHSQVEARVQSLSSSTAGKLAQAMKDLKAVMEMCGNIGMHNEVQISPLLCFKHELQLSGVCFQARLQKAKKKDVFAEGGRYDKLIQSLASPAARQIERSMVGMTIAVSKLSRAMAAAKSLHPTPSHASKSKENVEFSARRCEVYVVSYVPGFIEARLAVARELWSRNISTDLMYDDDFARFGSERIAMTARREGILFLVIVKSSNTAKDAMLKVKDLSTNSEKEVYRQNLVEYLAERLDVSSHIAPAEDSAARKQAALPSYENIEAHLSMPSETLKKMKHKQKQIVLEKAVDSVGAALASTPTIPLFAVDADGEAFRLMSESCAWILKDEGGQAVRKIVDASPPTKKHYIYELRSELKAYHARHNCRWMWLYSLKDTNVNLLTFV